MKCPKCGKPNNNAAKFCISCGAELPTVAAATGKHDVTTRKGILAQLTSAQKRYALNRYEEKKKSKIIAYLLWFFFGLYYFYLGKPVCQIVFWLLFASIIGTLFAIIWLIADLIRIYFMVDDINQDIFVQCVKEAREIIDE